MMGARKRQNERMKGRECVERYRNSVGVVFLQKLEEGSGEWGKLEEANEWNTKEILPVRFSLST